MLIVFSFKLNHLKSELFNLAQFHDTPSFPLEFGNLSGTNINDSSGCLKKAKSMSVPSL